MGDWVREFRYSARLLLRTPGFTGVAVLSLALGIGVNTAVLSVGRAVLVQALPVAHPDELAVAFWAGDGARGLRQFNSGGGRDERTGRPLRTNYSYPAFETLQRAAGASAQVFAFTFLRQVNVSVEGQPSVGAGLLVSGNYFEGDRRRWVGRGLSAADDRIGAAPAAVLGYALWQRAARPRGDRPHDSHQRPALHYRRRHGARVLLASRTAGSSRRPTSRCRFGRSRS